MSESINITKEVGKDGTESLSYRKSWEKNGLNFSKEVRKVEGGYIVIESKHGKPKDEDDAEWIDERKESVTTENPFDEAQDKSEDEKLFSFVDTPLM
jgi:hypothetical protein